MSKNVKSCDEKCFTNQEKCSIINIVFNQMHESALYQNSFFEKTNPKLKLNKKEGEPYE